MCDAIETITPANGYNHDLTDAVFRGRTMFGATDPLPMVSIIEPAVPEEIIPTAHKNPNAAYPWPLIVQGFVQDDFLNPCDPAYRLMAEVKQVLTQEKVRDRGYNSFGLGNRLYDLNIGQGIVRPNEEVNGSAFFWLAISASIVEDMLNPWA